MRRVLVAFCARLLRIFFRKIEVVGEHHVPPAGAVVFAANHPNGLLDPLLLLCSATRRVSFLAKAPLFRIPVVGYFVRRFESLPVYRSQDGADPAKNRAVLQNAVGLLERGNALGLFPEGVSHSSPELMRFKSGAARMALSARALGTQQVFLVPVFLYYEQKQTFRSRAVLAYGPPLPVPVVPLDDAGEAPAAVVNELTAELRKAIAAIAPTAATVDALVTVEMAERLIEVVDLEPTASGPSLAERMQVRRRLLDRYPVLEGSHPDEVHRLIARLAALNLAFERHGLPIDARGPGAGNARDTWPGQLLLALLLAVPGVVGLALHAPAYHLVRYLAERYSGRETDVQATAKVLSGLLLFPVTWFSIAATVAVLGGTVPALVALVLAPALGWAALALLEVASWMARQRRQSGRRAGAGFAPLAVERRVLADDIRSLLVRTAPSEFEGLPPNPRL